MPSWCLILLHLFKHDESDTKSVSVIIWQWSCRRCSQISWFWVWRSGWRFRITSRTVSARSEQQNQGGTRTSPVWEAMPWSTCQTSSTKDRWEIITHNSSLNRRSQNNPALKSKLRIFRGSVMKSERKNYIIFLIIACYLKRLWKILDSVFRGVLVN